MNNIFKNRTVIVLSHIVGWLLFFLVPYLLRPDVQAGRPQMRPMYFNWPNILQYVFLAAVFYGNAYFLIPRLLNRKKSGLYILLLIIICVVSVSLATERRHQFRGNIIINRMEGPGPPPGEKLRITRPFPGDWRMHVVPTLFPLLFIMALSTAYRFFLDKIRLDTLHKEMETEQLKSELSFLRSQISPHFIFNILNSTVSLARSKSDQVEPTLIKLSGLIRYMLYDTEHAKVPLNQEIEYLESYIDLQKLRFSDHVAINFSKNGSLFGHAIEPMLLIPFVENAFKHGIGKIQDPEISIVLREDHGILFFYVKNKYDDSPATLRAENSGIGLTNVKKRLELLYGNAHNLSIMQTGGWYEIKLNLQLK